MLTRPTQIQCETASTAGGGTALPQASVTRRMLTQMFVPPNLHYAVVAPDLGADETAIFGRFVNHAGHAGLRVHATDTLEIHDLGIEFGAEPKVSVAVFLEGSVEFEIDGERIVLGSDTAPSADAWVVARRATCRRRSQKGTHVRKVIVSVPPEWIAETLSVASPEAKRLHDFVRSHGAHHSWTPSKRAVAIAAQILNPPESPTFVRRICVESQAIEIVAEAVLELIGAAPADRPPPPSVRNLNRAHRVRAYLLEHIDEDLGLDRIAKHTGISVASMQRAFKQAYGGTIAEFVRECRLHKARHAMDREGISVSEAAYRAGYSNPANFSTAFKKLFGMTPSQARG